MRISDWSSDVCSSDLDELMDLREKLDLANAAAPALQVEAGAERLPLREMVANPVAHRADFLELPEIEAAAPDEGLDRGEEILAEHAVARRGPAANERRLLPRPAFGFIIGDRGAVGRHDGRNPGMRGKGQGGRQRRASTRG